MNIHPTADVSKNAKIGEGTKIWHQAHIREKATIGENCIISKNVYIDFGVKIGNNVKIQNNSSIYNPTEIENGVFIGPHVVLTNDKMPRAVTPEGKLKSGSDWSPEKITIKEGASVGAGSIILPGITIGKYSMVGAGSVVTKDIPEFTLAYGNPAKVHSKVCKCGKKISKGCKTCNMNL